MCTVTYIPTSTGFYFTSSRDEKASRDTLPPKLYENDGLHLVYPKDSIAGGTWIASSLDGRISCLLNGAFVNHVKKESYARSRGLVLLESFNYKNPFDFYEAVDLAYVEPLTLLLLDYSSGNLNSFNEFRWDGERKHLREIELSSPQIWSSATLYNSTVQQKRKDLFNQWLHKHSNFKDAMILDFHNRKHGLASSEDLLMKGEGDLMTLSISQIHFNRHESVFNYHDIINSKSYHTILKEKEVFYV
ncbi:MAG: NRDE family protein [Bacteroidetes bacterium]|nr:NRDE family protein [Bacteroidota bacterium]